MRERQFCKQHNENTLTTPVVTFMQEVVDNDTLREVPHPSNEGLALQARV